MRLPAILLFLVTSLVAQTPSQTDARNWINLGVQAYRGAQYSRAIDDFQKAVALEPANMNAHVYLATAYMTMYIPGANSPENQAIADQARTEFQRVLELKPNDKTALTSLASLSYQEAQGISNRDDQLRKLDESRDWNQKLISVDPQAKEAYYTIAVIDWMKWDTPYTVARLRLNMRPEEPGPIPDPNVRRQLELEYGQTISDGIANLDKALAIDPQYDDAMAYLNVLIRERADLRDTQAEYERDIATANDWVRKALDTRRVKAANGSTEGHLSAAPPTPPPPPAPTPSFTENRATPQRIRVGGNLQAANLLQRVDPIYPPLALQARVQGTVRFTANIAKDGHVLNLELVSGHPLLVASAHEALKQWIYRPTLVNGEPVEIVTQLDVNFTLPPQ